MIASLVLVAAGLLLIFGAKEVAGKFIKAAIGLALIVTVLPALAGSCGRGDSGFGLGWIFVLAVGLLLLGGWFRYAKHRRELHKFGQDKPTSLKRRVERGS